MRNLWALYLPWSCFVTLCRRARGRCRTLGWFRPRDIVTSPQQSKFRTTEFSIWARDWTPTRPCFVRCRATKIISKSQTGVLLAKLAVEMNAELVCFVCTFLSSSRFFLGSGVRGQIDQLYGLMAPHPPALLGWKLTTAPQSIERSSASNFGRERRLTEKFRYRTFDLLVGWQIWAHH